MTIEALVVAVACVLTVTECMTALARPRWDQQGERGTFFPHVHVILRRDSVAYLVVCLAVISAHTSHTHVFWLLAVFAAAACAHAVGNRFTKLEIGSDRLTIRSMGRDRVLKYDEIGVWVYRHSDSAGRSGSWIQDLSGSDVLELGLFDAERVVAELRKRGVPLEPYVVKVRPPSRVLRVVFLTTSVVLLWCCVAVNSLAVR